MTKAETTVPLWPNFPGLGSTPSELELHLTTALVYGESALIVLSICAFLLASSLLVFATKVKGRYSLLTGICLLVTLTIYSWGSMSRLEINSLLQIAAIKFTTVLGFSLIAFGYARLAWSLFRSSRAKNSA